MQRLLQSVPSSGLDDIHQISQDADPECKNVGIMCTSLPTGGR